MSPPTKDVTSTAAATGCHLLKIKGSKMIKNSHYNGRYGVESSKFQAAGHTWSFFFHPNEKSSRSPDRDYSYVCLKLHGAGAAGAVPEGGGIRANVRFSLVRRRDAAVPPWVPHERSYATSFLGGYMEYRRFRFVRNRDLEELWYIDDFALHCDVAVVEETEAPPEPEPELGPADDLESLMVCKCMDDLCKSGTQSLKEAFCKPFLGCFRPK